MIFISNVSFFVSLFGKKGERETSMTTCHSTDEDRVAAHSLLHIHTHRQSTDRQTDRQRQTTNNWHHRWWWSEFRITVMADESDSSDNDCRSNRIRGEKFIVERTKRGFSLKTMSNDENRLMKIHPNRSINLIGPCCHFQQMFLNFFYNNEWIKSKAMNIACLLIEWIQLNIFILEHFHQVSSVEENLFEQCFRHSVNWIKRMKNLVQVEIHTRVSKKLRFFKKSVQRKHFLNFISFQLKRFLL